MKCPTCNVPLVMSERQGVEIDYCPQCRGIWLDRGELDKIIERTNAENQQTGVPAGNSNDYRRKDDYQHDHHYDQKYRKKSWLNDLFD